MDHGARKKVRGGDSSRKALDGLTMNSNLKFEELKSFCTVERRTPFVSQLRLGQGAYSTVFKVNDKNKIYAIKSISISNQHLKHGVPKWLIREVTILDQLKRLKIHNAMYSYYIIPVEMNKTMDIQYVMEYYPCTLENLVKEKKLPSSNIRYIMRGILRCLHDIHYYRIIHRDLKTSNILIDKNGEPFVGDFGLSRSISYINKLTPEVVTLYYRSPEILFHEFDKAYQESGLTYNEKCDIWSAGLIMIELYTGDPPVRGTSVLSQLQAIFQMFGNPSHEEWPELNQSYATMFTKEGNGHKWAKQKVKLENQAVALIEKLLIYNPNKRISAKEALIDDYFIDPNNYPTPPTIPSSG